MIVNKIISFGSGFVNKRNLEKVSRKAQRHFTNNKDMEFDLNKTESDNEEQFKFDERKDGSNVTGYG